MDNTEIKRQVEAGYVRCATGWSIDGGCSLKNNAVRFTETWDGVNFTCFTNSQYTLGDSSWFSVRESLKSGCDVYIGSFINADPQELNSHETNFDFENTCTHGDAWQNYAWG